jgi:HK97 family phage major capsid protein
MKRIFHFMPEFPEIPAGLFLLAPISNDVRQAKLVAMKEEAADLQTEVEAIFEAADDANRDLTIDELKTVEAHGVRIATLTAQIKARESIPATTGRKTSPEPQDAAAGRRKPTTVPVSPRDPKDAKTFGFDSFGTFAQFVHTAQVDEGRAGDGARERLNNAATTYGNEGVGGDGGFVVPPDFRNQIWTKVTGEDSLLVRTEGLVTSSNSITIPADETAPWDTTNGIQAYWESEGGAKTPSKPAFEPKTARLNKLICFVPVTDELLEDAPALEGWLRTKAPQKMVSKLNTAIIRGDGVGKPLGIMNAGSLITISKEVSQNADSVVGANISKMWARLYAPLRRNAIWLINQDIEPQLDFLAFPDSNSGFPVPLYVPQGGLSAAPFSTLKGRPVVPVEAMSTLGDVGDIILTDLSQYMSVTKGTDVRTDVSIHLYFDQDITAFRFVLRVTGQPMWKNTIAPQFGSNTRSWAVALENRT